MALHLDITTIGGESFAVIAVDSWLVRDLKLMIDREHKFPTSRQRLFSVAGEELKDERALIEFCPRGMGPQTLMLVKVSKTQPEIEHFEKWLEETPAWLQSAAEAVMDKYWWRHNNWGGNHRLPIGHCDHSAHIAHSKAPVSVGQRQYEPDGAPDHSQVLTVGKDLLAATKAAARRAGGEELSFNTIRFGHGRRDLVVLRGGPRLPTVATATMEAMIAAIAMEPFVMLPYTEESITFAAMRRHPGLSSAVRDRLRNDRWFLYEALDCDAKLRKEFLATAGKTEINAWLWEREEFQSRGFRTKSVVKVEPATPLKAAKRGKSDQCCRERNAKSRRDKLPQGNRGSYQMP